MGVRGDGELEELLDLLVHLPDLAGVSGPVTIVDQVAEALVRRRPELTPTAWR